MNKAKLCCAREIKLVYACNDVRVQAHCLDEIEQLFSKFSDLHICLCALRESGKVDQETDLCILSACSGLMRRQPYILHNTGFAPVIGHKVGTWDNNS
jgi:hypothetical protein